MYLQKLDVSNRLVWCFPYEGQVSLQWLVRVGDSVTIFKASQQLGTRRDEDERASDFIVRHFASLKQKAHKIPGASHCHCKTKHGTQMDLSHSYGVNCNVVSVVALKPKENHVEQQQKHLTVIVLMVCLGHVGFRKSDFDFEVCNCMENLLESFLPHPLIISC